MKRKILSGFIAVALIFSSVSSVIAQNDNNSATGNGFRVSPVREEYTIEKGQSQMVEITVENVTGAPLVAHPIVNDFQPSDQEDGQPRILLDGEAAATGNSFKDLVGNIPNIPLQPGERKTTRVELRVPQGANAGGYYGAIRFSPTDLNDAGQVTLAASVGVIYLIKVPGDIVERLELLTLAAGTGEGYSNFFLSSPENTVVRLKNTGTIHIQPFGRIQVKDWRGRIVSDQEFNNASPRGNILPGSIRRFDTPLGSKLNFGKYTIEANLGYGTDTNELITASATIWVIPIWFIVALAVLIFAAVAGVYTWQKRRRSTRRYR